MLIFQLFLQISEICFQKAIVQYITLKTAALYLSKVKLFFVNINKKPRYPSQLFSALLAEYHQKFTQNDGITSILLIVTEHFSSKPIKNNLLQFQLLSEITFNNHSAVK